MDRVQDVLFTALGLRVCAWVGQVDEARAQQAAKEAEEARVEVLARLDAIEQQRREAEESALAAKELLGSQTEAVQTILSELQTVESRIAEVIAQREVQDGALREMREKEAEAMTSARQVWLCVLGRCFATSGNAWVAGQCECGLLGDGAH